MGRERARLRLRHSVRNDAIFNRIEALTSGFDAEHDLVRRAGAGEPEAWEEIYQRHYATIFRYVRARVDGRETAEDLAASVFLEALKGIAAYQQRGRPLLAWLYAIARNLVNYHHRSRFRHRSRMAGEALPRSVEEPASGNDALSGGDPALSVERLDLRRAVNALSKDQREVIILRHFAGLSTPEVARVIGKHERAVYSLQARAIKALRRRLA